MSDISGLIVYPSFLTAEHQLLLLDKLFNRDLLDPRHKTNVHMHYQVPYPKDSFFAHDAVFTSESHTPFSVKAFLEKKLRWMTLGGQYDWTNKVYLDDIPPFPEDIAKILEPFPMKAEAAIVNLYSPGDTLSLHRDVSEECNRPLVSLSIGCECVFVVGLDRPVSLRLRSGDAVLMSGESRYAWHGVARVIAGTCPEWLKDWPGDQYEDWRGWMSRKRINLNVRQMFE